MEYKLTEKFTQDRIDELLRIHRSEGLTAKTLLENAKDLDNPLHDLFEWNNRDAGEKWRLAQARMIINEVRVIVDTTEIYAFENISSVNIEENSQGQESTLLLNSSRRVYEPIIEILNDEEKRKQLLKQAMNYMDYWKNKYAEIEELEPVFKSIEKAKKKLKI